MVVKLFDPDISKENIADELERLKTVSRIDFAPTLGKYHIDERWYEEEFLIGSPPSYYHTVDSHLLLTSFKSEILPCLNTLLLYKPLTLEKCSDYVNSMISSLELSRLSENGTALNKINKIKDFISLIEERLSMIGNNKICLVLSHGDFCPANILKTKSGIKLLDWENAACRSAFFDFYSFFFYRTACLNVPINIVRPLISEAFTLLEDSFDLQASENFRILAESEHIYRRIFYIELMCRLVDRDRTDNNLNMMEFISRYIDAFNQYEEMLEKTQPLIKQQIY